jgi:cell surface protein SprA
LPRIQSLFCKTLFQDTIPAPVENTQFLIDSIDAVLDSLAQIQDSLANSPYSPSPLPTYKVKDRLGDPFSNFTSASPLLLKDPSALKMDVEIDTGMNYTVYEKIGNLNYRPTTSMSFDEFNEYQSREVLKGYWKNRSIGLDGESAVSSRNLIPPIYISPVFDKIFGGSYVEIVPRGFVTLDFGGRWQRIDNPSLPIRQQRNGGFEFDQLINMSVVGKIGEKLEVSANFDNNNSFDFENNLKVEYTGFEEDIIKKLEIGNVNLPISNSLITGAQNLFGLKTQLQFGKVFVTAVASTQRGKTDEVEVQGGGVQGRDFEVRASSYDENRHFFLGHFFRDNYEKWLQAIPQITSGVTITRVEVYLINRNNDTQTQRNIAAFMDLAEGDVIYQEVGGRVGTGLGNVPNDNSANNLYLELTTTDGTRDAVNLDKVLQDPNNFDMAKGLHYSKINGARKLDEREYTFHPQMGYLSLFRKLQNDEVLAVSYEYTYNGKTFKVGELTEDYSNIREDEVIFMKMLRPGKINIRDQDDKLIPTWDLMMKNIYSLNASQINQDGFQFRIIYRDDQTGIDNPSLHEGTNTKDVPLIELLGLDKLNPNGDPPKDGNFDFVEGITIEPSRGMIIFPVLEPFGNELRKQFEAFEQQLIAKYVYDTLYGTTKAEAELDVNKDKFFMSGKLQAGSSSEILLEGINIAEGSVQVFSGNNPLQEGIDYTVDYTFGKVTIINEGIVNSGKNIRVTYEKADLFNFQSRTLLGARFDYIINDDINFGGTILHHYERPLITRVSIGDEPTSNTKYGFDVNYRKESLFLTKLTDLLPGIQTKAPSMVNFNAEVAQLLPGTSNKVDGEGTSYIDDFENTATPFNLGGWQDWHLAATPRTSDFRYDPSGGQSDDISNAYLRASLAWYVIDNIFYRSGGRNFPDNLSDEDLENHYVRAVSPQEIFPKRSREVINTNQAIFDLAFYPAERGQYNYNPDLTPQGTLRNVRDNWGGISRSVRSDVDFDKTNIEYVEFWLMDPFIEGPNGEIDDGFGPPMNNTTGGKMFLHLGSISEDVMKDGIHAFENGLPEDGSDNNVTINNWGRVTEQQFINNAFSNDPGSRINQDLGLDGLNSEDELTKFFDPFINQLPGNITREADSLIRNDPSADNFQYFLGDQLDADGASILERYKKFNGMDGNSPDLSNNSLSYSPSGSTRPDNEDLNVDNTLSDLEEYYEYEIDLRANDLDVGDKYIVDQVSNTINGDNVTWYLFRVPVRQPDNVVGNISGFKSIRYVRMLMTDWQQPVVLRLANFRLVSSEWRQFPGSLQEKRYDEIPEQSDSEFSISVVNIEENSQGSGSRSPYVLPPGINRDRDNTSVIERQLNEQSLQLCIEGLEDKDARGAFKNGSLDLINYGRVKMFIHAESEDADDDELTGFLRLGTDFVSNYYEIEVPLKITPGGASLPEEIWPAENEIDFPLEELYEIKSERNTIREEGDYLLPFSREVGRYNVTIVGRPELSTVETLMIGVRNPGSPDEDTKSVCIWANELRVTDFDTRVGTAANATLNLKMADFANITASTRYTSYGFGGVQTKIANRTRDYTNDYDLAGSFSLDKFLPESLGLQLPMYLGYQNTTITPYFNPLDPDIPLESSLNAIDDEKERSEFEEIVTDQTEKRSINFTNVRKIQTNPEARNDFWDIENLGLSFAYNGIENSNYQIASYDLQSYRGSFDYNFNSNPWYIEPFKNVGFLDSKWLQLIKDFNFSLLPHSFGFRSDLDRKFIKTQYRNADLGIEGVDPNYEKSFTVNRSYTLRWNFSKGLTFDYTARANTIIDEPDGDIDTQEKRDEIIDNLLSFGRMRRFDQDFRLNYKVPLDKIPLTDWISSDVRYAGGYSWITGSVDQIEALGNIIENSRESNITGKVDLIKLYNKSGFLESVNNPKPKRPSNRPDTVQMRENTGLKNTARLLMMVRSLNFSWGTREGTRLPGFLPTPRFFGMDSTWSAPGWDFILGSQDPGIKEKAANNGWLVKSVQLSTPFTQTQSVDLNFKAMVEPFNDFSIQFDAKKNKTDRYQELFRFDSLAMDYQTFNPSRTGSYSISYSIIKTFFIPDNENNSSPVFQQFEENREVVLERLQAINPAYEDLNHQDVLVPSLIAAYKDESAKTVALTPFPTRPGINWRVDYKGLTRIPSIKEVFQSFNISHSYVSSYSVTNYTNSLLYQDNLTLDNDVENYPLATTVNENGDLVPVYVINQVVVSERFSPLIGISVRTRSRMTASLEIKRERNIALNLSNAQVTETNNKDYVFTVGFTKANMKVPFRVQGRTTSLKNDLTFRLDFNVKDAKIIQRKIDETNTITNGNISFQLRPNVSYVLNQRLNMKFYLERSINQPRVSNSFKRSTTAFGVQVRFSLAQ